MPSRVYKVNINSTGEFQALQLIVFAVIGAVDLPFASYILVHFSEM